MKLSNRSRMTIVVVALCVTSVFFTSFIGVMPDGRRMQSEARAKLCESASAQLTYLVSRGEIDQAEKQLQFLSKRNPMLLSAGIRRSSGELVAVTGDHQARWDQVVAANIDGCFVVPIQSATSKWGQIEYQFAPLYSGFARYVSPGLVKMLLLFVPCVAIATWLYFRRSFEYLDPSRVVPGRVRQTLDSFVEGVVLTDCDNRIVLANDAFTRHLDFPDLVGKHINSMPWVPCEREDDSSDDSSGDEDAEQEVYPWEDENCRDRAVNGRSVAMKSVTGGNAVFSANTSPVLDEEGNFKGLMIAFADVTSLEQKRAELAATLDALHQSKEEISNQNEELRYLATRDPLTGCINRRTFYESFQKLWRTCDSGGAELNVMMVDIDYFKSINDTHGHKVGDDVLKATAKLLLESAGPEDIVCRYGGEEFAVLVPNQNLEEAAALADRIRVRLGEIEFGGFNVTASLGVSAFGLGATDPGDMLDQADKCLYVAKRNGRDQVVRFDTVPKDLIVDESKISRKKLDDGSKPAIPFPAVTALLSALSFRDAQTGAHSTRVSNYAALVAQEMLSPGDAYVVEIAGLLHDIGKIGVADSILLKPGQLTSDEWEDMNRHDVVGVELVRKSFNHEGLTEIIRSQRAWFDGSKGAGLQGEEIPLGARILAIADSYDSMITDRPYRRRMTNTAAIEELRRCAGTQFDPEVVEVFIRVVASSGDSTVKDATTASRIPTEVVVHLGEQIERVVEAVENRDRESFIALGDRIRQTAEQNDIPGIAAAATHAVNVASEDVEVEELAHESFELLRACRSIHSSLSDASVPDAKDFGIPRIEAIAPETPSLSIPEEEISAAHEGIEETELNPFDVPRVAVPEKELAEVDLSHLGVPELDLPEVDFPGIEKPQTVG